MVQTKIIEGRANDGAEVLKFEEELNLFLSTLEAEDREVVDIKFRSFNNRDDFWYTALVIYKNKESAKDKKVSINLDLIGPKEQAMLKGMGLLNGESGE